MSFNTTLFEEAIREHMEEQPYSATCSVCGKQLDYEQEIDRDLDLSLKVEPCPKCCLDNQGS